MVGIIRIVFMLCKKINYSSWDHLSLRFLNFSCKLSQADGPTYKLLTKKEKAHDMDVNAVQWSSTVKYILTD